MNRRGANLANYGAARIPVHASDRETRLANLKIATARSARIQITNVETQDETIRRLRNEVQVLKKKLAFLQNVDLSLLSDDVSQGDVTFIVQNDTVIKAHRYILASKSSIFRKMFDNNMKEKRSGEIVIEDVSGPILRATIEFLYTAEITFTDETTAPEVFRVAHKYDIPELQAECEAHLFQTVADENLSEMLRISHLYGIERLREKSVKFFKENFDRVHSKVLCDLLS